MVRKKKVLILLTVLVVVGMLNLITAGGGGAIPIMTIELTEQGNDYNMTPTRLKFEFNEKLYAIQVREIEENYTRFLVMTLDMDNLEDITAYTLDDSFDLLIGDMKEIDIDKDGINDVLIVLNNITLENLEKRGYHRVVSFSIKRINVKKVSADEEGEVKEEEIIVEEEIVEEEEEVEEDLIDSIEEEIEESSLEDTELAPPNLWQRVVNWFKKLFKLR